jgi:hypothetical protein
MRTQLQAISLRIQVGSFRLYYRQMGRLSLPVLRLFEVTNK